MKGVRFEHLLQSLPLSSLSLLVFQLIIQLFFLFLVETFEHFVGQRFFLGFFASIEIFTFYFHHLMPNLLKFMFFLNVLVFCLDKFLSFLFELLGQFEGFFLLLSEILRILGRIP